MKSVNIFIGMLGMCLVPMLVSLIFRYFLEVYVTLWLNGQEIT